MMEDKYQTMGHLFLILNPLEQFAIKRREITFALVLQYFARSLANKTRATFSTNEKQN